jgi:predicted nucleic acid-binding protein
MNAALPLPPSLVVDCSVIAGMFLADEASPLAAAVRDRCWSLRLVAPPLLRVEFANVALSARRKGRLDALAFRELLDQGERIPVHYDPTDPSLPTYAEAAWDFGVTSYDYAYLDCARRRGLPLATLDRRLAEAALRAGVEVLTDRLATGEPRIGYLTPSTAAGDGRAARKPRRASRTHPNP